MQCGTVLLYFIPKVNVRFWRSRIGAICAYFFAVSAPLLSVHLSTCISAVPTKVFSKKFDTGDFYEKTLQ